jgi:hypothetical protein
MAALTTKWNDKLPRAIAAATERNRSKIEAAFARTDKPSRAFVNAEGHFAVTDEKDVAHLGEHGFFHVASLG